MIARLIGGAVGLFVIAFFFAHAFVFQAFKVPNASMEKTIRVGDRVYVDKTIYGYRFPGVDHRILSTRLPGRGDILAFHFPVQDSSETHCGSHQNGKIFLKRVVGLPGETVEARGGAILVNGQPLTETYAVRDSGFVEDVSPHAKDIAPGDYQRLWQEHHLDAELNNHQRDFFGPVTVPPHSYFVLGDNRDHSCDSRYWGPVDDGDIIGLTTSIYLPPERRGPIE